jgi:thiamine-phosphate pyrophosphorylase
MKQLPRLYAVADAAFGNVVLLAKALIDGGAELIQLRHKGGSSGTLLREAEEIMGLAPAHVRVIINDRADIARLTGAAGVHVGQDDLAPSQARGILADSQWVGRSTHTLDQALEADRDATDYVAVGPIFRTSTKQTTDSCLGLDQLRMICSRVSKPVVAIGGITLDAATDVLDCGVASIAVISDILRFEDPADRVREWLKVLSTRRTS